MEQNIKEESPDTQPEDSTSQARDQQNNETAPRLPTITETENDRLKLLFEIQENNLIQIIKAIKEPRANEEELSLPEFNPEAEGSHARSWCDTVDLCMQEKPLHGGNLIIAMSRALKGSAAAWLVQNSLTGITWPELKDSFLSRFDSVETPAAALYKILNSSPSDGESLSTYANRIICSLMTSWRSLSVEQIATALTLAHTAKIEPRVQRLAFTTEIESKNKLRQELRAFFYRKRRTSSEQGAFDQSIARRPQIEIYRKCYKCGKSGHRTFECRRTYESTRMQNDRNPGNASYQQYTDIDMPRRRLPLICFKCGKEGHAAPHCFRRKTNVDDSSNYMRHAKTHSTRSAVVFLRSSNRPPKEHENADQDF